MFGNLFSSLSFGEIRAGNPGQKTATPDDALSDSETVTTEAAPIVCPGNNTLPADLTVYLPLRKYTFTLKHQLLSGLGKVSQFVLKALSTEGYGLEDIERITGLTEEHLSPILTRLAGLGWYEPASRALTTQGHQMAKAAGLTGRRFSLWIDGLDNRNSPLILLSADQIVQHGDDINGIRLPEFERDWNILEVLQQQRLSRRLSDYKDDKGDLMPLLLLLCDEAEHDALLEQKLAWDFELELDRELSQPGYIELMLAQGLDTGNDSGKQLILYAPVLHYSATYRVPPILSDEIPEPAPHRFDVCLLSGAPLQTEPLYEQVSSWQESVNLPLSAVMEKLTIDMPADSAFLSKEVVVTTATRKIALSYSVLSQLIAKNIKTPLPQGMPQ
ncbi:hypothetical protein [Citrobacter sp. BDA59-3]|uniref:hypothetical protein n=1 Tax=Citrobacter sp. BDA59-3 TaxID=2781952 RepID=UPI00187EF9CF|nr:hypothetical protein [Citrobacter sp. BDA59-3]QOV66589.1 hypothetical protein IP582_12845 [Citrobacter sp. BDA59-3]